MTKREIVRTFPADRRFACLMLDDDFRSMDRPTRNLMALSRVTVCCADGAKRRWTDGPLSNSEYWMADR
jgi:hypothetical protein